MALAGWRICSLRSWPRVGLLTDATWPLARWPWRRNAWPYLRLELSRLMPVMLALAMISKNFDHAACLDTTVAAADHHAFEFVLQSG